MTVSRPTCRHRQPVHSCSIRHQPGPSPRRTNTIRRRPECFAVYLTVSDAVESVVVCPADQPSVVTSESLGVAVFSSFIGLSGRSLSPIASTGDKNRSSDTSPPHAVTADRVDLWAVALHNSSGACGADQSGCQHLLRPLRTPRRRRSHSLCRSPHLAVGERPCPTRRIRRLLEGCGFSPKPLMCGVLGGTV